MGKPKAVLLVIDDDRQYLDMVSTLLANEEVEVLTANDPVDGLDLVRTRRPDIVITDYSMPCMNGLQVLEWIVAFDSSIDVAVASGQYSPDIATEAHRLGAYDYISKPVLIMLLRQWVKKLVASRVRRNLCIRWDAAHMAASA